ncbi:MAG: hypothetical protein FJ385_05080 [Verrucomicrobia bacterium]|nr:hypothetical protein [Verrucomicrobiota bacterium]
MKPMISPIFRPALLCMLFAAVHSADPLVAQTVHVSRFWHNHQPTYWPEWNANGNQTSRVQYAWDSIVLKPSQNYGGLSPSQHPENNLTDIFGLDDRRNAYQSGPRNSLSSFDNRGGFAISYSGSLIDNVRQLGAGGHLGYGGGWNNGYREARGWLTPSGSRRMDLVGFTYHHSLAPLLPKSVLRKEVRIFKQAWWKAWGGNSNLSDHSKGFFPTEMGYSRHIVDVLADEGYEWIIVPSHHISRTSPSYNDRANPTGTFNIYSSPPNRADQIGPRFDNVSQWWYGEPNPGNAAWNVSPYAYQLHRVKYVNPETGAEKRMIAVPSDDVLSYRYGYANEGIGKIGTFIAPHATDPTRPVIVMPSTDGDNAWGGGSSSWFEATPQLFNGSASAGYRPTTPQDFVNSHGAAAQDAHIEDGAWIFPEMDYGSPYFLKWIEPPVVTVANRGVTTVPGTQVDMETPGFALKFYSYAPLMAGANWCETAEQILRDEGGDVQDWKIQAPYDWDGSWTNPNDVELAWHIYLAGLDSGFNYYGGLGNDDEMKPGLATRRAVEKLQPWMTVLRRANDRTPPTVLKPQRFPYNPGGYTFGWFNNVPGVDGSFLKRMNSEFYIWTHAYDVSGIPDGNVKVKVRIDNDGVNPLASNQNETYAGGGEVGGWVTLSMNKRVLPKTRAALNAAAANSQIDYFLPTNEVADYYFLKITEANLPGFRNKLLDYYIEATDAKGNLHKSEIQHVWVDDYSGAGSSGGGGSNVGPTVSLSPDPAVAGSPVTITYDPANRPLASAGQVYIHLAPDQWTNRIVPRPAMTQSNGKWTWTYTPPAGTTLLRMVFTTAPENGTGTWDNNGGADWNLAVSAASVNDPPATPTGLSAVAESSSSIRLSWSASSGATSYKIFRNASALPAATMQSTNHLDTGLTAATAYSYRVVATNAAGDSTPSSSVQATTAAEPLAEDAIRIDAPAAELTLAAGTSSYAMTGRAGARFSNGLTWAHPLSGLSGSIPRGSGTGEWSWTAEMPLAIGANALTISGTYQTSGTETTGSDSAVDYSSWSNSSNHGTGFGTWSLTSTGSAGHFLANQSSSPNLSVGESKGFGLWANNGGVSSAARDLPSVMATGDAFSIRIDNNWIDNGGSSGVSLTNTSGTSRVRFYFAGGGTNYRIDDAVNGRDSGIPYTGDGLLLEFTLTGADSYRLKTAGRDIEGNLAGSGGITRFVASNSNAGPNTERNFYLGAMTFVRSVDASGSTAVQAPVITVQSDTGGGGGGGPITLLPFRVTSIQIEGLLCQLGWESQIGVSYTIEATTDPANPQSWQPVQSGIASSGQQGTSTSIDLASTVFAGSPNLFLRVKAVAAQEAASAPQGESR